MCFLQVETAQSSQKEGLDVLWGKFDILTTIVCFFSATLLWNLLSYTPVFLNKDILLLSVQMLMATKVLDQVLLLVPHIVEMSWAQSRNNGFQKTYVFKTLITLNDKSHRGQTHLKMTTRRVNPSWSLSWTHARWWYR